MKPKSWYTVQAYNQSGYCNEQLFSHHNLHLNVKILDEVFSSSAEKNYSEFFLDDRGGRYDWFQAHWMPEDFDW